VFADSASELMAVVLADWQAGKAGIVATGDVPAGSMLVDHHAYMVDEVLVDAGGRPYAVRLRNPWAADQDGPASDGVDDGYVTVAAADLFAATGEYSSAAV
jgi:hypothetical protein